MAVKNLMNTKFGNKNLKKLNPCLKLMEGRHELTVAAKTISKFFNDHHERILNVRQSYNPHVKHYLEHFSKLV